MLAMNELAQAKREMESIRDAIRNLIDVYLEKPNAPLIDDTLAREMWAYERIHGRIEFLQDQASIGSQAAGEQRC